MKVIARNASAEIEEKKSRFIADVAIVRSEKDAQDFIASVKKRYWDCRHHCTAYVIGKNGEISRCTDDGEPAGTAGRPILELINSYELINVCIVVSRYFGGTLLGTGGLVRAYGLAAKRGIEEAGILEAQNGKLIRVLTSYDSAEKIRRAHLSYEADAEYGEQVILTYYVPGSDIESFAKTVTEVTLGKAELNIERDAVFALNNGKIVELSID